MNCRFAVTRLSNHLPYFRNLYDITNMVARCFSPFSIKRYFSLKNAKFDLFGSEIASWQIWLQIEWLIVLQATACKIRSTKVWVY